MPWPRPLGILWRDPLFLLALLAGPLAWWLLLGPPDPAAGPGVAGRPLALAMVAGLYPVLEEWLFRGLIQPQLLRHRRGRRSVLGISAANGLTSLLFAAAHLFSQPLPWAAAVMVPSLVFGAFRDRYRSVVPAIILHCFYNVGFFLWPAAQGGL